MPMRQLLLLICGGLILILTGCGLLEGDPTPASHLTSATVTRVIDGDTIDVRIGNEIFRVRYIGINTPERGEACYQEATSANRNLVDGQQVMLEKDVSDTDRYGRLLRYVYVGDIFINAALVEQGWAESVRYSPDTREFTRFRDLEQRAAAAGRGCHPTGIFNDGNYER